MNEDELHEELRGMGSGAQSQLRRRAEKDLFFFAKGILGMSDMNVQLHLPLCRAVESDGVADPNVQHIGQYAGYLRQMFLMSRGHLKSSVITVADSMRRALADPEHRIMFGNEVWENSVAFVTQIKNFLETNNLVRELWPDRIPERTAGPGVQWSGTGLTLVRKGSYREPTFFPIGVGGAVTSKHFTIINLDDLIGLEAYRSPAAMKMAIDWNNNVEPLVVRADRTIIRWIGTRWQGGDLYEDVIDGYGADLYIFHRTCYNPDGSLVFPELITKEFLERMERKDPARFAAQYLNDPTSGYVTDFKGDRMRSFHFDSRNRVVYMEDGEEVTVDPMQHMDRVMVVDPNSGTVTAPDEAAVSVTAQGPAPEAHVYSLENWAGRPNPNELMDRVVHLYQKWRPRVVGVEEAGQQAVIIFNLRERFRKEGLPDVIVSVTPGNRQKEERIRNLLQPVIDDYRYFVPQSQQELRTAIKRFPGVKLFDRLDAAAYCIKLIQSPLSERDMSDYRKATKRIMRSRSKITGY